MTSRRVLATVDDATHLQLAELDQHDSLALLLARTHDDGRIATEPEAAREIVRLCGELPMAVWISAARLVAHPGKPLAALASALADTRRRLDTLKHDDLAVCASFTTSLRLLRDEPDGADAAHLFAVLGLLDVPTFAPPVSAALTGWNAERTETVLDRLVAMRLVDPAGHARHRMHGLLRLYARELAETEVAAADRAVAVRRAGHCYLSTVMRAGQLLDGGASESLEDLSHDGIALAGTTDATAWLDAESENLVAVVAQLTATPHEYGTGAGCARRCSSHCSRGADSAN